MGSTLLPADTLWSLVGLKLLPSNCGALLGLVQTVYHAFMLMARGDQSTLHTRKNRENWQTEEHAT